MMGAQQGKENRSGTAGHGGGGKSAKHGHTAGSTGAHKYRSKDSSRVSVGNIFTVHNGKFFEIHVYNII